MVLVYVIPVIMMEYTISYTEITEVAIQLSMLYKKTEVTIQLSLF